MRPLPRSLDAALRDVRDAKTSVRVSAVRDLVHHATDPAGRPAIEALRRVLAGDVSAEARGAAAVALADAGATAAVGEIVAALEDSHLHVRQMALLALGELAPKGGAADASILERIELATTDEAPAIRFQALIALHRLEGPSVEQSLASGARDDDPEVRHVSLRLLEERATTGALEVRPSDAVRRIASAALADPVPAVRLAAAIFLGHAGDAAGASVIVEAIAASPAGLEPEDEQAAIALAAELSLMAAVPALRRRARGGVLGRDRFAYEARIALAILGDEHARAEIVKGLSSFSRDKRTLSVVAAGRARLNEARPLVASMAGDPRRAEPQAVEEALAALDGRPPSDGSLPDPE